MIRKKRQMLFLGREFPRKSRNRSGTASSKNCCWNGTRIRTKTIQQSAKTYCLHRLAKRFGSACGCSMLCCLDRLYLFARFERTTTSHCNLPRDREHHCRVSLCHNYEAARQKLGTHHDLLAFRPSLHGSDFLRRCAKNNLLAFRFHRIRCDAHSAFGYHCQSTWFSLVSNEDSSDHS